MKFIGATRYLNTKTDHVLVLDEEVLLTSFEKPSFHELLQPKLLWSDPHQGHAAGSQVWLELADLCCHPATHLTAEPAQEEQDHRLVLPQGLELYTL